jgi:hypothetical protein
LHTHLLFPKRELFNRPSPSNINVKINKKIIIARFILRDCRGFCYFYAQVRKAAAGRRKAACWMKSQVEGDAGCRDEQVNCMRCGLHK